MALAKMKPFAVEQVCGEYMLRLLESCKNLMFRDMAHPSRFE